MNSNTITNTITSDNDSGADMDVARDIGHTLVEGRSMRTKYSRDQVVEMLAECGLTFGRPTEMPLNLGGVVFANDEYVSDAKVASLVKGTRELCARDERMKPAPKLRESLDILVGRSGMMAVIKEIAEMKEEHMQLVEEARDQLKELKRLRDKIEEAEGDLASAMENLGCEDNDTDDLDNCESEIDECERLLTGEG